MRYKNSRNEQLEQLIRSTIKDRNKLASVAFPSILLKYCPQFPKIETVMSKNFEDNLVTNNPMDNLRNYSLAHDISKATGKLDSPYANFLLEIIQSDAEKLLANFKVISEESDYFRANALALLLKFHANNNEARKILLEWIPKEKDSKVLEVLNTIN